MARRTLDGVNTSFHRPVALLVAGCFFMENLDTTIVTTSAPRLADALGVATASTGLVMSAYVLALALFIPFGGWLTARLGPRRVFLSAIAGFTAASVACALSDGLTMLVAMRVLQGAAGAMMVPVGRFLVLATTAKPDIPKAMAYIVWPGLVAPVVAPLLGGLITTYAGWQWMFLINLPLGVVAVLAAWRLTPSSPGETTPPPLDVTGLLLTGVALGGLTGAAELVGIPWLAAAMAVGALVVGVLAYRHLRAARHPLIDLAPLALPSFRSAISGGSLFWAVASAVPFLLPLLFQETLGWSAVRSGAVVLFVFVGNIAIKPCTTWMINRFGLRPLVLGAVAVVAVTLVLFAAISPGIPVWVIAVVATVSGAARSVGLTAYMALTYSEIPADLARHANTLSAAAQQAAVGLGVAVAAAALHVGGGFVVAFGVLLVLLAAAGGEALRLRPGVGDAVRLARA